jgi:hypothetical protein
VPCPRWVDSELSPEGGQTTPDKRFSEAVDSIATLWDGDGSPSPASGVEEGTMKLKEYMATHEGDYLLAETTRTITVEELDVTLGELEVEALLLGHDPTGRRRIHLYAADQPIHLVTYVERATL